MKRYQNKLGLVGVITGLFIAVNDLSALTVAWGPVSAVPISNTGLMILSILLMGVSTLFILKSKTQTQKFLMTAFLIAGLFTFGREAVATVIGNNITIDIPEGNNTLTVSEPTVNVLNSWWNLYCRKYYSKKW